MARQNIKGAENEMSKASRSRV